MEESFNFGHFIPISTVDWYGRSVSVIFFRGCQMRCPYCQNHGYIGGRSEVKCDEIQAMLSKAVPFISAVVFSGGEPTLQPDALKYFAGYARSRSLAVGLQTNGYCADAVKDMIDERVLDSIFLDIKAPPDDPARYGVAAGLDRVTASQAVENAARTLHLCLEAGINVEIRTTVFRDIVGPAEVMDIGRYLGQVAAGDLTYVIQQGLPEHTLNLRDHEAFSRNDLIAMAGSIDPGNLKEIRIRTKENGDEKIH